MVYYYCFVLSKWGFDSSHQPHYIRRSVRIWL